MKISDLTTDEIDNIFLFRVMELMATTRKKGKSICQFDFDPLKGLGLDSVSTNITIVIAGGASCDLLKKAIEIASIKH